MVEEKNGPWTILKQTEVYKNQWMSVREDAVLRPDGTPGIHGHISMHNGVSVVALDTEGNTYLVKEFKYGIGKTHLQAVSGGVEGGDDPLTTAQKELKEELGITAQKWTPLGHNYPLTTLAKAVVHEFLAEDISFGLTKIENTEQIELVKIPFKDAVQKVLTSEISHASSCLAILKAHYYLQNK